MANRRPQAGGNGGRRMDFNRNDGRKNFGRSGVSPWQGGGPGAGLPNLLPLGGGSTEATLALASNLINLLQPRPNPVPSLLDMPIRRDFGPQMGRFDRGFMPNRMGNQGNFRRTGNYNRAGERINTNRKHFKPNDGQKQQPKSSPKKEADSKAKPVKESDNQEEKKDETSEGTDNNTEETKKEPKTRYDEIHPSLLKCHICNKSMWDGRSFENHLSGRAHAIMMQKTAQSYALTADTMRQEFKIQTDYSRIHPHTVKWTLPRIPDTPVITIDEPIEIKEEPDLVIVKVSKNKRKRKPQRNWGQSQHIWQRNEMWPPRNQHVYQNHDEPGTSDFSHHHHWTQEDNSWEHRERYSQDWEQDSNTSLEQSERFNQHWDQREQYANNWDPEFRFDEDVDMVSVVSSGQGRFDSSDWDWDPTPPRCQSPMYDEPHWYQGTASPDWVEDFDHQRSYRKPNNEFFDRYVYDPHNTRPPPDWQHNERMSSEYWPNERIPHPNWRSRANPPNWHVFTRFYRPYRGRNRATSRMFRAPWARQRGARPPRTPRCRGIREMKRHRRTGSQPARDFYCAMCDMYAADGALHRTIVGHRKLKKYLHPTCTFCHKEMPTRIEFDEHRLTAEHLRNMQDKQEVVTKPKPEVMVISTLSMEQSYLRDDRQRKRKHDAADDRGQHKEGEGEGEGGDNQEHPAVKAEPGMEVALVDKTVEKNGTIDKENTIIDYKEGDDLSHVTTEMLPVYSTSRGVGASFLTEFRCVQCKLCHKLLDSQETADVHLRTWKHHQLFVKSLMPQSQQQPAAESRGKRALPANDDDDGNWKRRKTVPDDSNAIENGDVKEEANEEAAAENSTDEGTERPEPNMELPSNEELDDMEDWGPTVGEILDEEAANTNQEEQQDEDFKEEQQPEPVPEPVPAPVVEPEVEPEPVKAPEPVKTPYKGPNTPSHRGTPRGRGRGRGRGRY